MWFFSYGTSTSPEKFQKQYGAVDQVKPALVRGHKLTFGNFKMRQDGGTSCIVPDPHGLVLGTAYLISLAQKDLIGANAGTYSWQERRMLIGDLIVPALVLFPQNIAPFLCPADSYIAEIREGLSFFYEMAAVDTYLRKALKRNRAFEQFVARCN